jgi:hypothetical protein
MHAAGSAGASTSAHPHPPTLSLSSSAVYSTDSFSSSWVRSCAGLLGRAGAPLARCTGKQPSHRSKHGLPEGLCSLPRACCFAQPRPPPPQPCTPSSRSRGFRR